MPRGSDSLANISELTSNIIFATDVSPEESSQSTSAPDVNPRWRILFRPLSRHGNVPVDVGYTVAITASGSLKTVSELSAVDMNTVLSPAALSVRPSLSSELFLRYLISIMQLVSFVSIDHFLDVVLYGNVPSTYTDVVYNLMFSMDGSINVSNLTNIPSDEIDLTV